MKPELILRSDLLDIIFEHKNKLYGAYQLRRNYPLHLWTAIGGMMLTVTACWLLAPKNNKHTYMGGPIIQILPDSLVLAPPPTQLPSPPPPKPIPIQRPPSTVASVKHLVPVIVKDAVQTEVPDQTILESNAIGPVTTAGSEDDGTIPVSQGSGTGEAPAAPVPPAIEEPAAPLLKASVMPSFPGGTAALQRWLSRHLRPQEDQLPGEKVRVVVRFVVGPTGEIDRIQLVQQGGDSFDKEVLRVINKMPKWEPGLQFGHPVAVWFTIPVIFEMPEQ